METHGFRAMGCDVVVGEATTVERERVRELFREWDAVFSRFRPESELNRVNRAAGRIVSVSPLFAHVVESALDIAGSTGGMVDPTLGVAIEDAGYTKDFSELSPAADPPGGGQRGCWGAVRLTGRLLRVPAGVRLDLNGVVKALAVDEALALLSGEGFVSAGGDAATSTGLDVGIPGEETVRVVRGGLATSGSSVRQWLRGGELQHHLIDPRTGWPARSCWEQVTACGSSCLHADAAAKAAFLLDEHGPAWLDEHGIPGRFVSADGAIEVNGAWRAGVDKAVTCT